MTMIMLACTGLTAAAQNYTTTNKKAIKLYESGADCMRQRKWECASSDLKKAAEQDPAFIEPRIYLAEMYEEQERSAEAMDLYTQVLAINPRYFPPATLHLADLEFAAQHGFQKIIFDRLVDVPDELRPLSYEEFYRALRHIAELREALGLHDLEIGNLEAYRRAIAGAADRVCTMFGSTCGAGVNNLMYMQREVYPCGRMFHQPGWRLGRFDEPLALFPERMAERLAASPASRHRTAEDGPAGPDCIIEQERGDYSARARDEFVAWYAAWLQRTPARTTAGPTVTAWPTFEDDEPDSRPSALIPAARLTVRPM